VPRLNGNGVRLLRLTASGFRRVQASLLEAESNRRQTSLVFNTCVSAWRTAGLPRPRRNWPAGAEAISNDHRPNGTDDHDPRGEIAHQQLRKAAYSELYFQQALAWNSTRGT
jgi:hypothetical protein